MRVGGREGWMREGMGARGCSGTARVPIPTGFQARTRRASAPNEGASVRAWSAARLILLHMNGECRNVKYFDGHSGTSKQLAESFPTVPDSSFNSQGAPESTFPYESCLTLPGAGAIYSYTARRGPVASTCQRSTHMHHA